mgnify:CR=1 FL=1
MSKPKTSPKEQEVSLPEAPALDLPKEASAVLEKLSPEERSVIIQTVQAAAIHKESFSGPIPHPDLLQGYDNVKSGFAERIVHMAEKEQDHRFESEKLMIKGTIAQSKRGQWFALTIALFVLAGAVLLAYLGHDAVASILGGTTIVGLVAIFITGKYGKSDSEK